MQKSALSNCNVGFIGLGSMGFGMAKNLVKTAYKITGYDIRAEAMTRFENEGADVSSSLEDLITQSDVIISSVPGPNEILELGLGQSGIFGLSRSPLIWIDCSTGEPSTAARMAAEGRKVGVQFLDCPVTGGAERAANGTLTMLIGGDQTAYEAVRPILKVVAKNHHLMGPPGSGYAAKLCQLHLNYVAIAGLAETIALARGVGIDLNEFSAAVRESCGQSYVSDHHLPQLLNNDYDDSFTLLLAQKDINLIEKLSKDAGSKFSLGAVISHNYQKAVELFGGAAPHLKVILTSGRNHSSIVR